MGTLVRFAGVVYACTGVVASLSFWIGQPDPLWVLLALVALTAPLSLPAYALTYVPGFLLAGSDPMRPSLVFVIYASVLWSAINPLQLWLFRRWRAQRRAWDLPPAGT